MMDLEPLDPDLAAWLEPGRAVPDVTPALRARVLERVESAVRLASPGGGGAAQGASGGGLAAGGKLLAGVFLVGGALGLALSLSWRSAPEREAPVAIPESTEKAPPRTTEPVQAETPDAPIEAPATREDASFRVRPRATSRLDAPVADTLARERILIDAARTALRAGDRAAALDALARHDDQFPDGQLRAERELLRDRAGR